MTTLFPLKLQWAGLAHQSKNPDLKNDYFGIANLHRLKFRNNSVQHTTKGETHNKPTIVVMSAQDAGNDTPRVITKDFIDHFRYDGRAGLINEKNVKTWVQVKLQDLENKITKENPGNTEIAPFSVLIIFEKHALLYQHRKLPVYLKHKDSVQTFGEVLQTKALEPNTPQQSDDRIAFSETVSSLSQHINLGSQYDSRHASLTDIVPVEISLKRKQLFMFCTSKVTEIISPSKFDELTQDLKCKEEVFDCANRIIQRTSMLNPNETIGAMLLRIC